MSLATYPVHRNKSTDVEAGIVSIAQEVYVGLYRKTYLLDEHLGNEIPKQFCVDSSEGMTSSGQERSADTRE